MNIHEGGFINVIPMTVQLNKNKFKLKFLIPQSMCVVLLKKNGELILVPISFDCEKRKYKCTRTTPNFEA